MWWSSLLVGLAALGWGQVWRAGKARLRSEREHAAALVRHREETYARFLAQFETRQQTLFNSMIEGILLLDQQGRVRMVNESLRKFFDVTTEISGQTIMEAFRWHELAALAHRLQREKNVTGAEMEIHRLRRRCWQVNAAVVADDKGAEQGQLFVFHEVTRLKELENIRTEFVGNVSHELRTPLSLIKGFAETLLDGALRDPQQASRFLQKIDKHADRLLFLIEDLLVISRLESGQIALNLQRIDLREVAQRVFDDLTTPAAARKTTLENSISPQTLVWADANRLQQVLFNLVDNAIKYGKAEGCVKVSAREPAGQKMEVSVADDGPGIPPEAIERVFERFFRVDRARSRESGGTGLGLAIVKHIVQAHGGEVWVQSQLQKGACFFFTLPQKTGAASVP